MSSVYTPTPVQLASITLPSDGDTRGAASINTPLQALADGLAQFTAPLANIAALAAVGAPADGDVRHVLGHGLYVFKTSATTGLSPFRVAASDATPGGWLSSTAYETTVTRFRAATSLGAPWVTTAAVTPSTSGLAFAPSASAEVLAGQGIVTFAMAVSSGSAIARGFMWPIDDMLVDGATLLSATLRVYGQNAHGALPALMPKFGIVRSNDAGASVALLSTGSGLATDASAGVAAYETAHDIVYTANQNNVIDKASYGYSVVVFNEGHTNAQDDLAVVSLEVSLTAIPDARRS